MDSGVAAGRFREVREGGHDIADSLAVLREEGASQIDAVKAVHEVESITLGEAKVIVDASPAWADRRESNERLRDEAIATFVDEDE